MPVLLEQFVEQLRVSGLLAPETLNEFLPPKSAPKDAEALARELVRQKKLTRFQAEEVYRGRGKSLVLGNYVLLEQIGAGGMGRVFKALHCHLDRLVAVKLLPRELTKNKAAVARFDREVQAAARLRHPNIVATDDADQAHGVHFLVMELVDGSDLSALIKSNGQLPVDMAVNYLLQAARGLEAAHAAGIVHRDIKPANLLLDKKGTVKILDMGLARIQDDAASQTELTRTGAVLGTVDYMAPEQAVSTKSVDGRADIYALGYTLFYLLTGKAAYDGDTLWAKILAHREHPVPDLRRFRPDVPGPLEMVFRKMVAKSIDDRFQAITQVIAALESWGAHQAETLAEERTLCVVDGMASTLLLDEVPPESHPLAGNAADESLWAELSPVQPPVAGPLLGFPPPSWPLAALPWATPVAVPVAVLPQSPLGSAPFPAVQDRRATRDKQIPTAGILVGGILLLVVGALLLTSRQDDKPRASDAAVGERRSNTTVTGSIAEAGGAEQHVEAAAQPTPRQTRAVGPPEAAVNDGDWRDLFDGKSLVGWSGDVGLMSAENGVLVNDGKRGVVVAPGEYQDFVIEAEFRLANGGNSGLGICYAGSGDPSQNGLEIQMLDDDGNPGVQDNQKCGSIYEFAAAEPGHFRRWPQWNQLRVTSRENTVRVELNGTLVTSTTRSLMKQVNAQHPGVSRTFGHVCLFPLQGRSEYRHLRIRSAK